MIRFGIVGAGNIAHKFVKDIKVVANAEVVAVASRSFSKATQFANQYYIKHIFGSYKELADCEEIDAVYIATPHRYHKENSILFLNNKKHVLCEKPIAVNQFELMEMIKAATRNNVLLMEAMWMRFLPAIRELKQIVQSKRLGEIHSVHFPFCANLAKDASIEGRLLNPDLAGGSLLDVGIYPISLLLYLIEESIEYTDITSVFSDTFVDLSVSIKAKTNSIDRIDIESSFLKDSSDAEILFDHGKIVIPHFYSADHLIINDEYYSFPHRISGFEYEIESFVETINDMKIENSIMTYSESLQTLKMLDDIREKIELKYPFEKKR